MHRSAGRLKFRIFMVLWLQQGMRLITISGFALGSLALVLRFAEAPAFALVVCLVFAILLPILLAFFKARSLTPATSSILAWQDRNGENGGLLMASQERDVGAWRFQETEAPMARVSFQAVPLMAQTLTAMAFALACILFPKEWIAPVKPLPMNIEAQAAQLEATIEALESLDVVSEEETSIFRESLSAIEEHVGSDSASQTWEALDHLEAELGKEAMEGAEDLADAAQSSEAMRELARMLDKQAAAMDPQSLDQAMTELRELMEKLAVENEALKKAMAAMKTGEVMTLEELAKAMDMTSEALRKRLQQMKQGRLISREDWERLQKEGGQSGDGDLMAFLEGEQAKGGQCQGLMDMAGEAGLSRGRGDAEMTWNDGADEANTAFKAEMLPPGALSSLEDSVGIGVGVSAPEAVPGSASYNGLSGAEAGGAGANTHQLLPKHRSAVGRYFKSKKE